MIPTSARWAAQVSGNHTPVYRVEVWKTGTRLVPDLRVESATVTKDASRYPRTNATVTVADTSPSTAQLLTPFGARLRFYRGVRYPDNSTELLMVADLDIVTSEFTRPDGLLELVLADPAQRISGATLPGPWRPGGIKLPSGTLVLTLTDAISGLMHVGLPYPDLEVVDQTPAGHASEIFVDPDWQADGDPWDAIEQLGDTYGYEIFHTPNRTPVIRRPPTLKLAPTAADVLLYALDGGVVQRIRSRLDRRPNQAFVWGAPDPVTGKQTRGGAADTATDSPTRLGGVYGRATQVETRPGVLDAAMAANAAAELLRSVQGKVRTVQLECVPNPALEPGDTAELRFLNGAKERHLITSVAIPFGPGTDDVMLVGTESLAYTTAGWP